MTYSEAITILMLGYNFTNEELKASYRRLSKKYHPDNFIDESEKLIAHEKMCEINNAYETLEKMKLKENQKTDNFLNIDEYREDLLRRISQFLLSSENDEYYIYLAKYNYKISNIITKFEKRIVDDIYISVNKDAIDSEYIKATNAIKYQFYKLQNHFFEENNIDASQVIEQIEYNCSLKNFYKQLLVIDKKYGLKAQINQKLNKELEEYTAIPDYDKLIIIFDYIKNIFYEKIISNPKLLKAYKEDANNLDLAKIILQMHKNIREYITNYRYLKSELEYINDIINSIDDFDIQFKFLDLQNQLAYAPSLDEIFKKLNSLKNSIRYYEVKNKLNVNLNR